MCEPYRVWWSGSKTNAGCWFTALFATSFTWYMVKLKKRKKKSISISKTKQQAPQTNKAGITRTHNLTLSQLSAYLYNAKCLIQYGIITYMVYLTHKLPIYAKPSNGWRHIRLRHNVKYHQLTMHHLGYQTCVKLPWLHHIRQNSPTLYVTSDTP